MNDHAKPALSRRPAVWLLLLLTALAPIAGCDCNSVLPVVPIILPPLSAVVVTPANDTLKVGESVQFSAVAYDTLNQPVAGAGFTWSGGNAAVFSVSGTGRVTAVAEGLDTVFAKVGGKTGIALVFVYADTGWVNQTSSTIQALNGVYFLDDGRTGWAVGNAGTIVHTSDAGESWAPQTSGTVFTLNSVWFTSALEGFAVGNNGTVLHTLNGGTGWTTEPFVVSDNLMDVTFANPDTGWAVGSNGVVLRTVIGAGGWAKTNITSTILHSVAFAGTANGWVVGEGGKIFGTHDTGLSWYPLLPSPTLQTLLAVSRRSAAAAWAAGAAGVTPRTIVGPDSVVWELRNAGASNALEGVHFPTALTGFAVGKNGGVGAILRTEDGGIVWQSQASHTSNQLNDVYFVDALRGWAVGEGGTIVHTARGGRN